MDVFFISTLFMFSFQGAVSASIARGGGGGGMEGLKIHESLGIDLRV